MSGMTRPLHNEDGAVMVITLLIMSLLTIIGISAVTTSSIDVQIAYNDRDYKQSFYKAEASALEAAQRLENMADTELKDISDDTWINRDEIETDNLSLDGDFWNTAGIDASGAKFSVVDTTGAIDLSAQSNIHSYTVYGVYEAGTGRAVIEMGYKKRF